MCVITIKFIGHLVNQQVLHELVALEALTLLLEDPTDDSVEVAVGFLKVYYTVMKGLKFNCILLCYCFFLLFLYRRLV
jgi:hypothetical protein